MKARTFRRVERRAVLEIIEDGKLLLHVGARLKVTPPRKNPRCPNGVSDDDCGCTPEKRGEVAQVERVGGTEFSVCRDGVQKALGTGIMRYPGLYPVTLILEPR